MPPEPLPWDRNKKYDRSDTGIRSVARWRDSHPPPPPAFPRWDRSQGHAKHHLFSDDSVHHMPFRASDRMVIGDDTNFRPRGSNKYGRSNARGSFFHRDMPSARQQHHDLITYASRPHSDIDNSSWDHLHFKDHTDKLDALAKEHSLPQIAWKPLKWNRSTALSSRGSATSSSRTMGPDSDDVPSGNPHSLSCPAAGAAIFTTSYDDACPKKKQRLGWGQGLAKYEKQKVEGSDETFTKNGPVQCATIANQIQTLPHKTAIVTAPSECPSPVTSFSVVCRSSPGRDNKLHINVENNDNGTCNLTCSSADGFQSCLEEFSANLENLSSITNLSSLLSDLLQLEDSSSGDSNFFKSSAMNKLLLVKSELSKALEKTECEIDLFENELKLLNSDLESSGPHSVASDFLQVECTLRPCENMCASSKAFYKPDPLQLKLISSSDIDVDTPNLCNGALEGIDGEVKDDDIDSPGTATSKFVEPLCKMKPVSAYSTERHNGSVDMVAARPVSPERPWFLPSVYDEKSASISGGQDGHEQVESSITIGTYTLSNLNRECDVNDLILVSNRNSARKALEVFSDLLPADQSINDMLWGTSIISCHKINPLQQKIASRKCFQRFKERVHTFKYRALHHLWKEDMRLRKYKAKSQRRIESNPRTQHVYQKHRSSIRSRFTSPGNLTLVPTSEIVDFTGNLFSDFQFKLCRDHLKMPALVDEKERRVLRFVSSNGLVKEPCAVEKEKLMINPWTPEEQEIFLDKFAIYWKDFKKIALFLKHKTTADCVEFYYKNHKSETFEKIKKLKVKKQEGVPTSKYMRTSSNKWNPEVNAASLNLLGEASMIAAHADNTLKSQVTYASRSFMGGHYHHKTCWGDDASCEKSSSADIIGNERETMAADTLAGICGALSSEAMSSCVTSSVDPVENFQEGKIQKNYVVVESLTPKFMQSVDDEETCSDESCGEMDSVDWTDEEKSCFICALRSYGKDFVKIARCVRSRSKDQCKVFFSKARRSLGLDIIHLGSGREGTPLSDANGGRSDTEDACVLEMESTICSTQSCSKLEIDYPLSVYGEASEPLATSHLQTDKLDQLAEKNEMEQLKQLPADTPERSGENDEPEPSNCGNSATFKEKLIVEKCDPEFPSDLVLCGEDSSVKTVKDNIDGSFDMVASQNVSKEDSVLICDLPEMHHVDAGCTRSTEGVKQHQTIDPVKESITAEVPAAGVHPMSWDVENKAMLVGSAENSQAKSRPGKNTAIEGVNASNWNMNTNVDADIRSSSGCFDLESSNNINSPYQAAVTSSPQSFNLTQNHQHQIPLELLHSSIQKVPIIPRKQKENTPVSANPVLPRSSLLHYEEHQQQRSSPSTLNFEGTRNERHQKQVSSEFYPCHLLSHHSLDRVESSQILRGYPLQVLSKKDVNGHVDSVGSEKQSIIIQNSTVNGNFDPPQFIMHGLHREKYSVSKLPHSLAELPFLSQNHEQSLIRHTRAHSQGSSDADDSRRIGDVKLFGQILSHPSTSQKASLMTQEIDTKGASLSTSGCRSFDMKFANQSTDRASTMSKLDSNKYSGLEEFPARSNGFWDGSKIHTGFSSLPDSSILLTKYPAAFSDYSAASSCGDSQSLPGVTMRHDRNLNSGTIYPGQDMNSIVSLPDYQVYRGYDGANMHPYTVDVKRHDALSDLQKRNGLEMGFQKQSRAVVGMNVTGTSILVGGGCTGVSDPVVAIKKHYATTELYAAQGGSIREEDSWRGDLGRF